MLAVKNRVTLAPRKVLKSPNNEKDLDIGTDADVLSSGYFLAAPAIPSTKLASILSIGMLSNVMF